jgi:hypothetical protein
MTVHVVRCDGLLEGVIGGQHADGIAQLAGARLHTLLENPPAGVQPQSGPLSDITVCRDEHRNDGAGLAEQDQRRGYCQNLESQAAHGSPRRDRAPSGDTC